MTTDDASVKLGKNKCMAHWINLAITDVFYRSTLNLGVDIAVVEQNCNDDDGNGTHLKFYLFKR